MSFLASERLPGAALLATGVALAAFSLALGHAGLPLRPWIAVVMWGSVAVGVVVTLSLAMFGRRSLSGSLLTATVVLAIASRLLLVGGPHDLSDDSIRYQWDGRVLAHGINPYAYAPEDPQLASLRTETPGLVINHSSLHTVYPPLAQGLFAVAHLVSPRSLIGLQVMTLLAELLSWLLLARMLVQEGLPRSRLLLAAWLPLVLLESYRPGHVDTLTLPFVALGVRSVERRQPIRAGVFLALATLIKPYPLLMVPAALREFGWRGSARFLSAIAAFVVLGYLPFVHAGHWLFDSMWLMASTWSFNGSLAPLLGAVLPAPWARLAAGMLMFGLVGAATRWGASFRERALLAVAAFVACTPTLYPWYLVWALPLLVLEPDPALLSVMLLAPLSYVVLIGWHEQGAWSLPAWVGAAEYVPFYFLVVRGAWRRHGMFRRRVA